MHRVSEDTVQNSVSIQSTLTTLQIPTIIFLFHHYLQKCYVLPIINHNYQQKSLPIADNLV